jgi:hypothetical protein
LSSTTEEEQLVFMLLFVLKELWKAGNYRIYLKRCGIYE